MRNLETVLSFPNFDLKKKLWFCLLENLIITGEQVKLIWVLRSKNQRNPLTIFLQGKILLYQN